MIDNYRKKVQFNEEQAEEEESDHASEEEEDISNLNEDELE